MIVPGNPENQRWFGRTDAGEDDRVSIFCLPYAGGGSAMFSGWQRRMPRDFRVVPIRLPGRETRHMEPCYTSVSELVSALASAMAPLIRSPYAIFGHSMGALIGFELVREFRRRGFREPLRLFVSAAPAPQCPLPDGPISHFSDGSFLAEIQRRYGGVPAAALESAELLELMLPLLKADFTLIETYVYEEAPALSCPMTCFGGAEDSRASASYLQAWRLHTTSDFSVRLFPGDHFFFANNPDSLPFAIADQLVADIFNSEELRSS